MGLSGAGGQVGGRVGMWEQLGYVIISLWLLMFYYSRLMDVCLKIKNALSGLLIWTVTF